MFVGTPYGHNPQILVTDGIGGSPYGPGTLAGTDGSRQPVDAELTTARNLGSRRNSSMISRARVHARARETTGHPESRKRAEAPNAELRGLYRKPPKFRQSKTAVRRITPTTDIWGFAIPP